MAGERLARRIKDARPKESELADLVYGEVTSTLPMKIRVENRFEVDSPFIELSQMVQDYSVNATVPSRTVKVGDETGTVSSQTITVPVFRSLRTGDKVRMLRAQKSQKYYVLERV